MDELKECASFEQVKPIMPQIIELKSNWERTEPAQEESVNIADGIEKAITRSKNPEEIKLYEYLISLKLSELLTIQSIMYIGRDRYDGEYKTADAVIKDTSREIANYELDKGIIADGIMEKIPLIEYLDNGVEYLESL